MRPVRHSSSPAGAKDFSPLRHWVEVFHCSRAPDVFPLSPRKTAQKHRGRIPLAWRAIDHGAHGAPYVQTSAYACSRVGCAVRTMGFCRPGGGDSLCRLPVGRGRGGVIVTGEVREKDGAAPGPWPHLLNAPIGDGVQPPPHRPGRASRTGQVGDRPASETSGSVLPFLGAERHVGKLCHVQYVGKKDSS